MHARRAEERINASCDLSKLLRDPILEGCSFHYRCQIHKPIRKPKCSDGIIRQITFNPLYGTVEVESEPGGGTAISTCIPTVAVLADA